MARWHTERIPKRKSAGFLPDKQHSSTEHPSLEQTSEALLVRCKPSDVQFSAAKSKTQNVAKTTAGVGVDVKRKENRHRKKQTRRKNSQGEQHSDAVHRTSAHDTLPLLALGGFGAKPAYWLQFTASESHVGIEGTFCFDLCFFYIFTKNKKSLLSSHLSS